MSSLAKLFGMQRKANEVNVTDAVFLMHTKLTVVFLVLSFTIVGSEIFFGKPINCLIEDTAMKVIIERHCWMYGPFIMQNITEVIHGQKTSNIVRKYQHFYDWILIILASEAILSYLPLYIWNCCGRDRIQQLCSGLGSSVKKHSQKQKIRIVEYLTRDNSRCHSMYYTKYIMCEVMNCIIVAINMLILNLAIGNFWVEYFPVVSSIFEQNGEFSSLATKIFPKMVKCRLLVRGPHGQDDVMCLVPINSSNEKIFVALYIWYSILLLVSVCNLVYRWAINCSSYLRFKRIQVPIAALTKHDIKHFLSNTGDWFFIFHITRNLEPSIIREILDKVIESKTNSA